MRDSLSAGLLSRVVALAGHERQLYSRHFTRLKWTVKTTPRTQRDTIAIEESEDDAFLIRAFWAQERGVREPALLQRFHNFFRAYPRYRDVQFLRTTMYGWDAAILKLFEHDRGMEPANFLARRHPYLLNVRLDPARFALLAVRGNLPGYDWAAVLEDIKVQTGHSPAQCQQPTGQDALQKAHAVKPKHRGRVRSYLFPMRHRTRVRLMKA